MAITIEALTFEQQDEFSRRLIAEKAIKLLMSEIPISPLVINGGWGTGKSTFCHKLINLINATHVDEYHAVYVDAFKADHADEPLMTLLAAILSLLPEQEKKTLREKALPALRVGLKTSLKAVVSWALKQDATDVVEDFEDELKDAGNDVIDSTIESLLKDHEKAEQNIQSLKTVLQELTKEKKILICVDELDRCRPDFAVAILENIKHIFDVEGVQFILVTNADQLRASINHRYGTSVDAHRYLDKFIKFSFELPRSNYLHDEEELVAHKHLQNMMSISKNLSSSCLIEKDVLTFCNTLVKINKLSLREVESFLKNSEIYIVLTEKALANNLLFGYALFRIFAIFIFTFKPALAKSLLNQDFDVHDITKILGYSTFPSFIDGNDIYPTYNKTIAAILFMNSLGEKLEISLESQKEWQKHFSLYFRGGDYYARQFNAVKVMREVISILMLHDNKF